MSIQTYSDIVWEIIFVLLCFMIDPSLYFLSLDLSSIFSPSLHIDYYSQFTLVAIACIYMILLIGACLKGKVREDDTEQQLKIKRVSHNCMSASS